MGDGSLEGTLNALNTYLDDRRGKDYDPGYVAQPELSTYGAGLGSLSSTNHGGHQATRWQHGLGKMLGCQVGHSGTLDPQVSGVLLIMLGNAVRLAPLLLQHEKEYICLMRLQVTLT